MNLAFCLFKYFPFGGLQRDFLRIAQECIKRGHTVHVYTIEWQGDQDLRIPVTLIPIDAWQNHTRNRQFVTKLQSYLANQQYDLIVGFNKMPGLDVYFAADACFQTKTRKKRGRCYRFTPRYQQSIQLEKSVFSTVAHTQILLLAQAQQQEYFECYQTPAARFHLLPPGISQDRIAPDNAAMVRATHRKNFNMTEDEFLLLLVGSGFKTKGLDRALLGLAHLPDEIKRRCHFFIIGKDNPKIFQRQAEKLGIATHIKFLGGRDDVSQFLLAADLLLHPAYNENTGTVLLEALTSGLPVLTTDVCGYAHYVSDANAGKVLDSPFQQAQFDQALTEILSSPKQRKNWQNNALLFTKTADIYHLPQRAVDVIESCQRLRHADCAAKRQNDKIKNFDSIMQLQGEIFRELEGRKTQRILFDGISCFIKQHVGVGWKEIFKNLLQLRLPVISAKNEWLAIQRLQQLNILAPEIIHYDSRGCNPAKRQSFLITRELPPTVSLEDFCKSWKTHPPVFRLKQALLQEVARIARVLHENHMNHRDFYLCHFLLEQLEQPLSYGLSEGSKVHETLEPADKSREDDKKDRGKLLPIKLYLIDLHRAQIHKKIPIRWIIKDLAGLYFSSQDIGITPRDYFRFMKHYRGNLISLREILNKEKKFWLQVKKRGDKLYQKHE